MKAAVIRIEAVETESEPLVRCVAEFAKKGYSANDVVSLLMNTAAVLSVNRLDRAKFIELAGDQHLCAMEQIAELRREESRETAIVSEPRTAWASGAAAIRTRRAGRAS